jgi:hypothetical protein
VGTSVGVEGRVGVIVGVTVGTGELTEVTSESDVDKGASS